MRLNLKLLFFPVIPVFLTACAVDVHSRKDVPNLEKSLADVFYLASFAPSAHNTQMYSVVIYPDSNKVKISLDDSRLLKVADPFKREALISLGAYVRALEIAYLAYGYKTETKVKENSICLNYAKQPHALDEAKKNNLLTLMQKRHTDKREFKRDCIEPKVLNEISSSFPSTQYLAYNTNEYEFFKESFIKAFTEQAYNHSVANELSSWMRFSDSEAKAHKDGLPAEQLGITGIKKFFYYAFMDHDSVATDSFAKKSIEIAKTQALHCAGYLVLKSKSDNFNELIETGKTLYDLMLYLTKHNLAIQPLSAALEAPHTRELLSLKLNTKDKLQMILRLGYVDDYGKNYKIRRDLHDYIKVESSQ